MPQNREEQRSCARLAWVTGSRGGNLAGEIISYLSTSSSLQLSIQGTKITGRQKGGFVKGGGSGERTLVPVFVPGEHSNGPSFRFSFRGNIRMYPRSGFRSGGTSAKTTLLENHPFSNRGQRTFRDRPGKGWGGQICLCVAFLLGKKGTHKRNSQEISGKGQDSPDMIPGKSL